MCVVPLGEIQGAEMENVPLYPVGLSSLPSSIIAEVRFHGPSTPGEVYMGNVQLPVQFSVLQCAQSMPLPPTRVLTLLAAVAPSPALLLSMPSVFPCFGLLPCVLLTQPCFEKPHGVLPL